MEGLMKAVIVMLSLALIVGYAFQGWEGGGRTIKV
jgi:hypothetical protein